MSGHRQHAAAGCLQLAEAGVQGMHEASLQYRALCVADRNIIGQRKPSAAAECRLVIEKIWLNA